MILTKSFPFGCKQRNSLRLGVQHSLSTDCHFLSKRSIGQVSFLFFDESFRLLLGSNVGQQALSCVFSDVVIIAAEQLLHRLVLQKDQVLLYHFRVHFVQINLIDHPDVEVILFVLRIELCFDFLF